MKYQVGVPMVVELTSAAKHDHYLLKKVHLPKESTLTMDRAYIDYAQFQRPEFGLSNSPFSFDDFDIKRGFLGQETICRHGCHEICGKPSDAPVARVFNLNDVLQFVVYRLDQRPFSQ